MIRVFWILVIFLRIQSYLSFDVAVLDSLKDGCYLEPYGKSIQLKTNFNFRPCQEANSFRKISNSHAQTVLNSFFEENPEAQVTYYPISYHNSILMEEQLIIEALQNIKATLKFDNFSIRYVLMCFGANQSFQQIQSLIEDITNTYYSVIFIAAAGNEGPSIGTVLFPAWLPQIIAISTFNIISSKGPSPEESKISIIKPDFVLKGSSSTSIAAARLVGFLSNLNRFHHRGHAYKFLLNSAEIVEDFTIFEQGYGQLDLHQIKQQITTSKQSFKDNQQLFEPLLEIYPSIIDLRMKQKDNVYWEPLLEQIFEDENDPISQWVCVQAHWNLLIINNYLKMINFIRIDNIGNCSINAYLQPSQIQENNPISRINLILEKNNQAVSELTKEMDGIRWEECTFEIIFEVFEEYSHQQIHQTSKLNQLKLKIINDQSASKECKLEEKLTLKSIMSTFYQEKYSFNAPSFIVNIKYLSKVTNLCQTSLPLGQLQSSHWDLLLIAQISKALSSIDQQFMLEHLQNPGKILIMMGSGYVSHQGVALLYIQSLNEFLKQYGVQLSEGQFYGEICEDQNKCLIFKNGCEISLNKDSYYETQSVQSITLNRGILQDGIQKNGEKKEIIYSARMITSFSSVILLLNDNSCLLERYLHKSCFHLINQSIEIAQQIKQNSIQKLNH